MTISPSLFIKLERALYVYPPIIFRVLIITFLLGFILLIYFTVYRTITQHTFPGNDDTGNTQSAQHINMHEFQRIRDMHRKKISTAISASEETIHNPFFSDIFEDQ